MKKFIWLFMLLGLFLLPSVSAVSWSNTTFNNSLGEENLTFTGNQNITRWLAIPSSVNVLTNAFLNLSSVPSNLDGNYTNRSDGFSMVGAGGSRSENVFGNGTDMWVVDYTDDFVYHVDYDGNNLSGGFSVGGPDRTGIWGNTTDLFVLNYGNGIAYRFLYDGSDTGESVDTGLGAEVTIDLWGNSTNLIFINKATTSLVITNYSGSTQSTISISGTGCSFLLGIWGDEDNTLWILDEADDFVYHMYSNGTNISDGFNLAEHGILDAAGLLSNETDFWIPDRYDNFIYHLSPNSDYVSNVSVEVGVADGVHEWNYTGEFNQTNNRTSNLASVINLYLNATYLVGTNYIIPFIFHSDTLGILEYIDMLFDNDGFLENSQTYQSSTFDTAREVFQINVSFDSTRYTSLTGTLVYNGTRLSGTASGSGSERVFSAETDIGLVTPTTSAVNRSFYWELAMTDSNGQALFNSTEYNQIVEASNFSQTATDGLAVNYTTYSESDQALLDTDFDATFTWRLNESSAVTKNLTVTLTGASEHLFYINTNRTFFTDLDLELDASGYTSRSFGFNDEEFSNATTHIQLYLLNESSGTNFILRLKDIGLFPLPDYTIEIYRKLPGGDDILVEHDITDHIGEIVVRVVENEVKYRLLFYNGSNSLVKSIPNALFTCTTTVCQKTFVVQELTDAFEDFDDIEDHSSSLEYNNGTRTFTFVWVDNTGESSTHRLLVERITFANGTEVSHNTTSTSSSGVLTYTADTSRAAYRAQAFRLVGTDEDRLHVLNEEVGDYTDTFSLEGLYWSFILFMLMLLIGRFYPPAGVILYLFAAFLLGIFDIVYINPAIMIAQVVIGVLFIWAFRG